MGFRFLRATLGITGLMAASLATSAMAQTTQWPTQPIRIVVPFSAGAATDLISRQLGMGLGRNTTRLSWWRIGPAPRP
jgi:tripartite-type tricarboxylate transporter receptor subunit TctC